MSCQALYMHLNQHADDDGFCEYFGIMRMCGANADDLSVLRAKNFVRIFDDKVLILKDWKENNYIQQDRYHKSKYLDVYNMDTECIQDVSKMDTEVRVREELELGKSKDREVTLSPREGAVTPRGGNPEINQLVSVWREVFSTEPDGSRELNRRAAHTLLQRAAKDPLRVQGTTPLEHVSRQIRWLQAAMVAVPKFPTVASLMDLRDKRNAIDQAVNRYRIDQSGSSRSLTPEESAFFNR